MRGLSTRVVQSAVAWSFLNTALRIGANLFALPLLLRKLPPEHLGLWYVFGALAGFATLLDFGFSATITRMVSYVWAGASELQAFGIRPQETNSPREPNRLLLTRVLATFRSYYRALGAGVLVLLLGAGGCWVWVKTAHLEEASLLRWAWVAYALGTCLNLVSSRWPALLAGIGSVREAQRVGVIGSLTYYFVAIAGLYAGFGLLALVSAMVAFGVVARILGRIVFTRQAALPEGDPDARFDRTIFAAMWPNAWRMGLVSLGAFLIIQSNTLICSGLLGLATTASYGISFQLVTMLVGVSSVWLQVKFPTINQLRVSGDRLAIARLFAARMRLVLLTYAAGALVIIFVGPWALQWIGARTRLLPKWPLTVLCAIQLLEMHHSHYAALVLSENVNPFLKPALVSGVLIVVFSLILTPSLGIWGLLISAGVVQAAFNNWWPVLRGVTGLGISYSQYARLFFLSSWKTF